MPFRPMTDEEKSQYNERIEQLQKDIDIRQESINYMKQKINEGVWYSGDEGEKPAVLVK